MSSLEEPIQIDHVLIDIGSSPDRNPLLPSNPNYDTPTLPILQPPPAVVIENPYSEIVFASTPHTDISSIPISSSTEADCSIVCLFVVLFHVTRGHEIVWSQPDRLNLDGVELKAVPSGMHTIERDFIYFRKAGLYGLSCYAKRTLHLSESEEASERGARMMAVGVLSISPDYLPSHINFLATSIQNLLDNPNEFSHLSDYYASHSFDPNLEQKHPNMDITLINTSILSAVSGGHDFARFIQILGPSVFVLWKFLLLQSRIMFYSKPPIGPCCNWVYFTCLLTQCDVIKINPNPHFYVSVADLDTLKEEHSYVACCTEQILQIKKAYYDVFIPVSRTDGAVSSAKITCPGVMLRPLLFINNTDINRYRSLMKRCDQYRGVLTDREQLNQTCIQFFREINNNIFSHFTDYAQYESLINPHLLRRAGLDAYGDFSFLRFFSQTYNLRLNLQRESEVSSLLCCSPRGGGGGGGGML